MNIISLLVGLLMCACVPVDDNNASGERQATFDTVSRLSVQGTRLVNDEGHTVVLRGVSYGWHNWWPRFYNASTVETLHDDWGCQVVRAAMGVEPDGAYLQNPEQAVACITGVADAAIANGIYVIIDWHCHHIRTAEAIDFFAKMATKYKGIPNVIYEIFNEPEYDSWKDVKAYSIEVIKAIREIDKDALILVGNPHWDQDVHIVADDPITGYDNLMYTLHFYAATHKQYLRDCADRALAKGIPIFVSECAGMEASGDGPIDLEEWNNWQEWLGEHNISWVVWSLTDKDETCSMIQPEGASTGHWAETDLKEWGKIIRTQLKSLK